MTSGIYSGYGNYPSILLKKENEDMLIVELGASLHDIADSKFHRCD